MSALGVFLRFLLCGVCGLLLVLLSVGHGVSAQSCADPQPCQKTWSTNISGVWPAKPNGLGCQLDSVMSICWLLDAAQSRLWMRVEARTTGWLALGLPACQPTCATSGFQSGTRAFMGEFGANFADTWLGWVQPNALSRRQSGQSDADPLSHEWEERAARGVFLYDYRLEGTGTMPIRDGQNDLLVTSGQESNGVSVIEFQRNYQTGESASDRVLVPTGNTLIWAYGSADPTSSDGVLQFGNIQRHSGSQRSNPSLPVVVRWQGALRLPSPPQNFDFSGLTSTAVNLSWTAPLDLGGVSLSHYLLEFSNRTCEQNLPVFRSVQVPPTNTTYRLDQLGPQSQTCIRLRAVTVVGASSAVSFPLSTPAEPLATRLPVLLDSTTHSLRIGWSDLANPSETFVVRYANVTGGQTPLLSLLYSGMLLEFNHTDLGPGQTYQYTLQVYSSASFSPMGPPAEFRTNTAVAQVPTDLSAQLSSAGQPAGCLLLSNANASDSSAPVLRWEIRPQSNPNPQTNLQPLVSSSQRSFQICSLAPGTAYQLSLVAINAGGPSSPFSLPTVSTAPVPPADVTFVPPALFDAAPSTTSVRLEWLAPATSGNSQPVQSYEVFGRLVDDPLGQFPAMSLLETVSSPNLTVTVSQSGTWEFQVLAVNTDGLRSSSSGPRQLLITRGHLAPRVLDGEFTSRSQQGQWTLHWRIDNISQPELVAAMQTPFSGWIAFGFGFSMTDADMIIGWVDQSGQVQVGDYYSQRSPLTPVLDTSFGAQNDVLAFAGQRVDGITTIKFRRRCFTTDVADNDVLDPGFSTQILYAFHRSSTDLRAHAFADRGSTEIRMWRPGPACPAECSGPSQGVCEADGRCRCLAGFAGDECAQRVAASSSPAGSGDGQLTAELVEADYPNRALFLNGDYELFWRVLDELDPPQLEVAIRTTGLGWVAIGFGRSVMAGADIYMASVSADGSAGVLLDMSASGNRAPVRDTEQNVLGSAFSEQDGRTLVKFRRRLDNQLDPERDVAIVGGPMSCIVAYAPSDDSFTSIHARDRRAAVSVDWLAGTAAQKPASNKEMVHGVLMSVAWAVCVTVGILLARFFKWLGKPWFYLHIALNMVALVLTWVAFGMAIDFVQDDFRQISSAALAHAWLGLFVVIGGTLQPILGYLADRYWDPARKSSPVWPDQVHWWLGRATMLAALICIPLGMLALEIDNVYMLLYLIWLGLLALTFMALQTHFVYKSRRGFDAHGKAVEMKERVVQREVMADPKVAHEDNNAADYYNQS